MQMASHIFYNRRQMGFAIADIIAAFLSMPVVCMHTLNTIHFSIGAYLFLTSGWYFCLFVCVKKNVFGLCMFIHERAII